MKKLVKMNDKPIAIPVLLVAGLLSASAVHAATLLDQNFESTSPVDIANGTTVANFTAATDALGQVKIVSAHGSNVLQLTDSSTADGIPHATAVFSQALSSGATGENGLTGSFDFCMPTAVTGASRPTMIVGIGKSDTTGEGVTAIQITMSSNSDGSYSITYVNGPKANTSPSVSAKLTAGVWYRVELAADFSNLTQDTYSIKVYAVDNASTMLINETGVKTRTANLNIIDRITFMDGSKGTDYNTTDPIIQVDNLKFNSVSIPEVATLGMLTPGALLLMGRKK